MAAAYGLQGTTNAAASGDLSITPPTNAANDLMIAAISARDTVVATWPAGWTSVRLDQGTSGGAWAYKFSTGSEGAFTVTHTAGGAIIGFCDTYTGVDTTTPMDTTATSKGNADSGTVTATGLTPVTNGAMIIMITAIRGQLTQSAWAATAPATLTERQDAKTALGTGATIGCASALQTTAGATGNATCTLTGGTSQTVGFLVALRPLVASSTRPVKMAGRWGGFATRGGGFAGRSRQGLHIPNRFGDQRMAA